MSEPDRRKTELEDTGDIWLAFSVMFLIVAIAATFVLRAYTSIYLAAIGAISIGIAVGWICSWVRFTRRLVSEIVQWIIDLV